MAAVTDGEAPLPSAFFRRASAAMSALFLFAAFVQWNDPDPLLWIGLYLAAALLAGLAARGRTPIAPNALAALLFATLALAWSPSLPDARSEAFTSLRMREARDEEPRETLGLLLCTLWTGATAVGAYRRTHRTTREKPPA